MRMLMFSLALVSLISVRSIAQAPRPIPVIYSTDLYHPHVDLDDHFDLAQLFAMPEYDVKAIILDINGQTQRTGRPAVEQMMAMTGKRFPFEVGLKTTLKSLTDRGEDQPAEFQKGVALILRVLRESPTPLTIITAGSLRDIVASYNREPELFRAKVLAIHINIGNATVGGGEYNVDLDPISYCALLQSGLPVVLYPCFPADSRYSTYWRLDWNPLFQTADYPRPLRNYFLYAMEHFDVTKSPAMSIFSGDFPQGRPTRSQHPKEMWCTPSLLEAGGRTIYRVSSSRWIARTRPPAEGESQDIYRIVPARIELDEKGRPTKLDLNSPSPNIRLLERGDPKLYEQAMASILLDLYRGFPVKPAAERQ